VRHDAIVADDPCPLAIVDVGYGQPLARAACVVARGWADAEPARALVVEVPDARAYAPGRFFERELPCLLAVLERVHERLAAVIVDGYVVLDERGTPGLGGHLHAALGGAVAVVGVAKTAFRGSGFATPVERGTSARPLYVTAAGLEVEHAARLVASMHGAHRIPTLLRHADQLSRGLVAPPPAGPAG
jgi:deoxyribonuclease V